MMSKNTKGSVFLLDAISPRTVAIARSLGKQQVQVTCADESPINLGFFSRYCRARMVHPSPIHAPQAFVESLLDYLDKHPQDCMLAVKEESLDVLLAHRQAFEQRTHLPFPANATFQVCRDKRKTMALAVAAGVPHPRTIYPENPRQIAKQVRGLRFPLVIKPRLNCSGLGIRYVQNEKELQTVYAEVHSRYPFPLIQEQIPAGEKYDVACLFDENSRPVATFAQRELRSFPIQDGASTVQESVWRPDLVELTVQLLQKAGWYGIAEAEFMIDPRDGTPMLLEINPRFWGSVQLAIQSGVDFPHLLYRIARGERVEAVHQYKVGQMCRQLLPYDILHFLNNPNRFQMQPSFFDFANPRCGHNLFAVQDPGPVFGFMLSCGRYLFDLEKWKNLARMEKFADRLANRSEDQPQARPASQPATRAIKQGNA
jgi:predicted ATP-grasp superfamily ATP-dependent carboligase